MNLTTQQLKKALELLAAGQKLRESEDLKALRVHVQQLATLVRDTSLPRKADGTDWTDDEIANLADRADDGFLETLVRERGRD